MRAPGKRIANDRRGDQPPPVQRDRGQHQCDERQHAAPQRTSRVSAGRAPSGTCARIPRRSCARLPRIEHDAVRGGPDHSTRSSSPGSTRGSTPRPRADCRSSPAMRERSITQHRTPKPHLHPCPRRVRFWQASTTPAPGGRTRNPDTPAVPPPPPRSSRALPSPCSRVAEPQARHRQQRRVARIGWPMRMRVSRAPTGPLVAVQVAGR